MWVTKKALCVYVCVHMYTDKWKPQESTVFLGTGVLGGCELPNTGTGTSTRSSVRAASALNHEASSLAPKHELLKP